MGACFGCFKKTSKDTGRSSDAEMSATTSPVASVTCKIGMKGSDVRSTLDTSANVYSISGNGTAIGSCSLDCDTAYWEVVVGENPSDLKIGIKRYDLKRKEPLDGIMDGKNEGDSPSWILQDQTLVDGDVIGVRWDQTDLPMLSFTKNGVLLDRESINRVRPAIDIFPAVSVQNNGSCKVLFDEKSFKHQEGNKFKMIVCATNLI